MYIDDIYSECIVFLERLLPRLNVDESHVELADCLNEDFNRLRFWKLREPLFDDATESVQTRSDHEELVYNQAVRHLENIKDALENIGSILDGRKTWDQALDSPLESSSKSSEEHRGSVDLSPVEKSEIAQLGFYVRKTVDSLIRFKTISKPYLEIGDEIDQQDARTKSNLAPGHALWTWEADFVHHRYGSHMEGWLIQRLGKAMVRRGLRYERQPMRNKRPRRRLSTGFDVQSELVLEAAGTTEPDIDFASISQSYEDAMDSVLALQLPHIPNAQAGGELICPVMGEALEPSQVISARVWENHVFTHLKPYICIYQSCGDPRFSFADRDEWYRHENQVHPTVHACTVGNCNRAFLREENAISHLWSVHQLEVTGETSLVDHISVTRHNWTANDPCPFCGVVFSIEFKHWEHVALHLEQLALITLNSIMFEGTVDRKLGPKDHDYVLEDAGFLVRGKPPIEVHDASETGVYAMSGAEKQLMKLAFVRKESREKLVEHDETTADQETAAQGIGPLPPNLELPEAEVDLLDKMTSVSMWLKSTTGPHSIAAFNHLRGHSYLDIGRSEKLTEYSQEYYVLPMPKLDPSTLQPASTNRQVGSIGGASSKGGQFSGVRRASLSSMDSAVMTMFSESHRLRSQGSVSSLGSSAAAQGRDNVNMRPPNLVTARRVVKPLRYHRFELDPFEGYDVDEGSGDSESEISDESVESVESVESRTQGSGLGRSRSRTFDRLARRSLSRPRSRFRSGSRSRSRSLSPQRSPGDPKSGAEPHDYSPAVRDTKSSTMAAKLVGLAGLAAKNAHKRRRRLRFPSKEVAANLSGKSSQQ